MLPLDSIRKLKNATDKLRRELSSPIGNISLNYDEQELVRRIFKSVFVQLKNRNDIKIARTILRKTEWIDG